MFHASVNILWLFMYYGKIYHTFFRWFFYGNFMFRERYRTRPMAMDSGQVGEIQQIGPVLFQLWVPRPTDSCCEFCRTFVQASWRHVGQVGCWVRFEFRRFCPLWSGLVPFLYIKNMGKQTKKTGFWWYKPQKKKDVEEKRCLLFKVGSFSKEFKMFKVLLPTIWYVSSR